MAISCSAIFFFECEKRELEEEILPFCPFFSFTNTWQAASTKLEERNTIANVSFFIVLLKR